MGHLAILQPVWVQHAGWLVVWRSDVSAAGSVGNVTCDEDVEVRQLQSLVRITDHKCEHVLTSRSVRRTATAAIEAGVKRVLE